MNVCWTDVTRTAILLLVGLLQVGLPLTDHGGCRWLTQGLPFPLITANRSVYDERDMSLM